MSAKKVRGIFHDHIIHPSILDVNFQELARSTDEFNGAQLKVRI